MIKEFLKEYWMWILYMIAITEIIFFNCFEILIDGLPTNTISDKIFTVSIAKIISLSFSGLITFLTTVFIDWLQDIGIKKAIKVIAAILGIIVIIICWILINYTLKF